MKTTYLVLGAMAIAAASVAPAAAKKAQPIVVSIDSFCNVETITLHTANKGSVIIETGDGCDENYGTGVTSKIKGSGQFANFSLTSAASPGANADMVFQLPLQTGNTVTLNYTVDGINQITMGPYTYTVVTGDAKAPKAGAKSITSLIPRH
jgi:hypothetical protein